MSYANIFEWGMDQAGHIFDRFLSARGYWDPYYAGYNPVRYDSPQYAFNQVMASMDPVYGSLYRLGGEQAVMDQYAENRDWNGIVQHPGSTSFGGYSQIGSTARMMVSKNIGRLYR